MRFHVHVPETPLDLRNRNIDSLEALAGLAPEVELTGSDTEVAAMQLIRKRWPGGLAMPFPVQVGSGRIIMLGVLPSVRQGVNRDAEIPFVAFVRPVAESERDRKIVKGGGHRQIFTPTLWQTPLDEPNPSTREVARIEMRSTDLEVPVMLDADVGLSETGELVIAFDVGAGRVSLAVVEAAVLRDLCLRAK